MTVHAFITLHKDRVEFKVKLPNGILSGSDPYSSEQIRIDSLHMSSTWSEDVRESYVVGQTILRLIRLSGVTSFEVHGGDDLPDAVEYRGGDYGDDDIVEGR